MRNPADRAGWVFLRPEPDGSWPLVVDLLGRVIITVDGEHVTAFCIAAAARGVGKVAALHTTMTHVARMLIKDGVAPAEVPNLLAFIEQTGEDTDTAQTRADLLADLLPGATA